MMQIFAISLIELRLGIRSRWVLLSTLTLLFFAVLLVLLGGAPTAGVHADPIGLLVASLATLSVYLLPLIALLLSFDSIAGEVDRGTLQLLLATPIPRGRLLLGKFLGHVAVLAIAVVLGYGLAGALALTQAEGSVSLASIADLLRLIGSSILMGAAFIAIGLLLSTLARQTATAAALAILTWLLCVVLYDLALLGGLILAPEGLFAGTLMPYFLLINPADAFRVFNMALLDLGAASTGLAGSGDVLPFPPAAALASPIVATVLVLVLCIFRFKRIQP
jgi:Cu-processing system permease protein